MAHPKPFAGIVAAHRRQDRQALAVRRPGVVQQVAARHGYLAVALAVQAGNGQAAGVLGGQIAIGEIAAFGIETGAQHAADLKSLRAVQGGIPGSQTGTDIARSANAALPIDVLWVWRGIEGDRAGAGRGQTSPVFAVRAEQPNCIGTVAVGDLCDRLIVRKPERANAVIWGKVLVQQCLVRTFQVGQIKAAALVDQHMAAIRRNGLQVKTGPGHLTELAGRQVVSVNALALVSSVLFFVYAKYNNARSGAGGPVGTCGTFGRRRACPYRSNGRQCNRRSYNRTG